ncbi:MAG: CDP-alcohol phosphatidyltransferase family protein [Candidatus Micrarchaeota archaeon]|nr:CDP-alcohol phosphatidyltransferase family protein [Candidatus Micrarchaeota archaeon]
MLYKRRSVFRKQEEKIGKLFAKAGLSPNQWTLLSLLLAFAAFYSIIMHNFAEAAAIMLASAFIDIVDGSVARATGKASKTGAYLDTITDRYVEFIVVFALFLITLPQFLMPAKAWLFLYLFGALMTTYAKSAAKEKGLVKEELKGGFLERAERMLLLFIGLALASFNVTYLVYVIAFVAVVSNVSALQRIWKAMKRK